MHEPLQLREAPTPATLVLVRFGRTTLADEKLRQNCEVTFARWGLHGFSVLELPGGDYRRLARLVPLLVDRRQVLEAAGSDLLGDGFPVLPTREHPHWTVILAEPTAAQFARVRRHFSEPKENPVWARTGRRQDWTVTEEGFDLRYDPNEVGGDLVVECWISHGPRGHDDNFDPQPSDFVSVGDDEEPPLRGRVVRRDGNRVWVQLDLPQRSHAVA